MKSRTASPPLIQTKVPLLTLLVARDNGRFMARCTELNLVTEMDHQEEAIQAMIEMIQEYAEDYTRRIKEFATSPNRAHHRPYVDRIAACGTGPFPPARSARSSGKPGLLATSSAT